MNDQLTKLTIAFLLYLTLAVELKILSKEQWKGQSASGAIDSLHLPVSKVIIAHTATKACFSEEDCSLITRFIQTFQMESRKFSDIAYNFLVGGDGVIYEGRNWYKQGAHTKGYNNDSICIAFIGTFINEEPTREQLRAVNLFLEKGVQEKNLTPDYKMFGQSQFIPSESPGRKLYKIIKTWLHWSEV